ncbi:MAG: outer membrane beta-barrel protein [Rikenellaceae bacterium]|jgi:hypothetical protein|nr:outer membrane beta-barrel protein [Rikenellaceae bacterium]
MKKFIISISALALAFGAHVAAAQEPGDTTEVFREEIIIEEDSSDGEWEESYREVRTRGRNGWRSGDLSIGLGYSGLVENLGNLSLPDDAKYLSQESGSDNVNFDFLLQYRFNGWFSFMPGLGMEVNNFRWDNNMYLAKGDNGVIGPVYVEDNLRKSKMVTGYLNVPMLFKIKFSQYNRKAPYIYGGVIGGGRIFCYDKIKEGGNKDRMRGNLNLRNFHWGYTVGIGIRGLSIYARYYPQSIFRPGEGPQVEQVNIGVSLGL